MPIRLRRLRAAAREAAPALLGFAAVRTLGVAILAYWGHRLGHPAAQRMATLWDAQRYIDIAVAGYDHGLPAAGGLTGAPTDNDYSNLAFFPLYPALIRLVHTMTPLPVTHAALLITWVASLAAAWGIFAVAAWCHGRRAGVLAVVLWGVLPHAVVESMAYTEALFTALASWSLYAVLTRRWIWAGVLCALAGLTRPTAVALVAAVVAAAVATVVRPRGQPGGWAEEARWPEEARWAEEARAPEEARWRPCLGAAIAPLGWLGFIAWVGDRLGRWDGYFAVQMLWHSRFDWGVSTVRQVWRACLHPTSVPLTWVVVTLVLCAAVFLGAVVVARRQPLPLLVYSVVLLAIAVGDSSFFGVRARFLLPAFPLLLPVAACLARVRSGGVRVALLSTAAVLSALYGAYLVFADAHAP
ncbi:glycosyltransferase family 39 protein [Streptomyces lonegramiae]|uniref:Glycosyltransferase family 39 protein n=1 Tax=Streptomyces lonegramiae TaxID=3075524 RepID=A0ABU2X7X6_9ACTN|nr:glycosyltransferase family 39 protein [Streptomyces sp. DSM 41529]MDT0542032.1 glycosyltransferase family 39 protein [Streptomyces sp. DSM 41529]